MIPKEHKHEEVRSRNESFAQRTATRIWSETPSIDNPYIATSALCHGYDLFELMEKRSFVDVFFLLFRGELPTKTESALLQALMISFINPGPRHPATRAAMNAGIGKTDPVHILPIASAVLGGEYLGGGEVEKAMLFLQSQQANDPHECARHFISTMHHQTDTEVAYPAPGFGKYHGGVDLFSAEIANRLFMQEGAGNALKWSHGFVSILEPHGSGWLSTGVAAATFLDLGFQPRTGSCLFQLLGAPGLLAHGLEMASKPILAMPFVSDENYVIER